MKALILYLAFLIIVFSFIPYAFTSCNNTYDDIGFDHNISLYDKENDKVLTMNIEDYIVGVVSAEMPASFSEEALKSQAVAARTYTMHKMKNISDEHKGAKLCTDFAHCQAYIDNDKCKSNWGKDYKKNIKKITRAVKSTSGDCLIYNDDFAITVFHSCSNGITEKASDVWGGEIEYLKNVESMEDTTRQGYKSKLEVPKDDFVSKLKEFLNKDIDLSAEPIGDITYTDGKNISMVYFYGTKLKATDIRKIFELKSTAFSVKKEKDNFVFEVLGNGHGVGMSQYGADNMAKSGANYTDILNHYYPGTKLMNLNN